MEKQDFNNPQNHTNTQANSSQGRTGSSSQGSQPNKTGSTGTNANGGRTSTSGSSNNR